MKSRSVPFFSLQKHVENIKDDTLKKVQEIMSSQQFVGGRFVDEFEKKLGAFLDDAHVVSCNSGTDGLFLALKALNLKTDSCVLTTPFSFIASSSEIVALGAHPVFIDIEPSTYNMDLNVLQSWLEKNAVRKDGKTLHKVTGKLVEGIVAVDIFGQCMDYDKLRKLANVWGLWIVEDACQSIGANVNDKKAGTFGDIGVFSFYPTKNLGAFGDGGAVVTANPELAERVKKLKNHGRGSHYNYEFLGVNSRMDAFQAAVLSLKLDKLNQLNQRRQKIAQHYNKAFESIDFIQTPQEHVGHHVYHQYSINISGQEADKLRTDLIEHLKKHNVGCNVFYPKTLQEIDFLSSQSELKTSCPVAQGLTKTILALPVWPELSDQDVEYVCKVIHDFACQHDGRYKETLCSVSRFYGGDL